MDPTEQSATKQRAKIGGLTQEERVLYRVLGAFALVFPLTHFPLRYLMPHPYAAAITAVVVVLSAWAVGDRRGWRASFKWALALAVLAGVVSLVLAAAFGTIWPVP